MYFRTRGLIVVEFDRGSRTARACANWRPTSSRPGLVAYRDERGRGLGQPRRRARLRHASSRPRCSRRSTTSRCGRSCASSCRDKRARQGVARALLDARDRCTPAGARRDDTRGLSRGHRARPRPAASAFHGIQSMFERAGFEVVEVRQWNTTSPRGRSCASSCQLAADARQIGPQAAEHHRRRAPHLVVADLDSRRSAADSRRARR